MKKVLAVVFAAALVCSYVSGAFAQGAPNVTVYFDLALTEQQAFCPPGPIGTVQTPLYVVVNNANSFLRAIEYSITLPPSVFGLGPNNVVQPGALVLGDWQSNLSVSYPVPQNAFFPYVVQIPEILWLCNDCDPGPYNQPVIVTPNSESGKIRCVLWPSNSLLDLIGNTSLICAQGVPVQQRTWGAIKSMYDN